MSKNFFDLVCQALPPDLATDELMAMLDAEWWEKKPRTASAYVLRNHPRLDWETYRALNEDVAEADLDPCLHFLKHGIFEGRKLYTRHPFYKGGKWEKEEKRPLVSVAITLGEEGPYQEKSIRSVLEQTLENIEVIIAPWSEDAPLPEIPETDIPVKFVKPDTYKSLHAQRAACVKVAEGRYTFFLDSHDFLDPEAMEKMAGEAAGMDIVACAISPVGPDNPVIKDEEKDITIANRMKARSFPGHVLFKGICFDRTMDSLIYNKLYDTALVKGAFEKMTETPLNQGADIYEYTAIVNYARHLKKLNDRFYFRNRDRSAAYTGTGGVGIGETWLELDEFIASNNLGLHKKFFRQKLLDQAINVLLSGLSPEDLTARLNYLQDLFGLPALMEGLIVTFFKDWKGLGSLIKEYKYKRPESVRCIGIFYHRISYGGVEKNISILSRIFAENGYKLCLFLEEKTSNDFSVQEGTEIYYVTPTKYDQAAIAAHTASLEAAVRGAGIDLMIYMAWHSPILLWDIALLHFLNVPVIVSARGDFTFSMMDKPKHPFKHADYLLAYKCADKLHCLSKFAELYYQTQGIPAIYIPNPSREPLQEAPARMGRNIAVIARLSDKLKQLGHSLLVLKEVLRVYPDAKLYIVGGFGSDEENAAFNKLVDAHGISRNICLTGWLPGPDKILDMVQVFLSTSITEGFPNGINEAQSRGVPCVIYNLTIMLAEDNESIIQVPQGDYRAAAAAIIDLLDNPEKWRKFSGIALEKIERFSEDKYTQSMLDLVKNFAASDVWKPFSAKDFRRTIKAIMDYRDLPIPG